MSKNLKCFIKQKYYLHQKTEIQKVDRRDTKLLKICPSTCGIILHFICCIMLFNYGNFLESQF